MVRATGSTKALVSATSCIVATSFVAICLYIYWMRSPGRLVHPPPTATSAHTSQRFGCQITRKEKHGRINKQE